MWCVEGVGDHHGQETGLKRDFDSSRKKWTFCSGPLLCHRLRKSREETACKRKRTEISLVFVTIMLHVLTYVVSNKFWNRNGVVRFVSQEVWFDKGFVIWHFRNYCLVQIMSLWSLSTGVGIIFTTNELVDRTRNFKSNASRFKQKEIEKNAPQARFLWNKIRCRQDLSNKMCRSPEFLTKS